MVTTLREIETIFDQVKVGKKVLDKISVWRGDITKLEVDAIVNAANRELSGGGGVDGAIHSAAGHKELQAECRKIGHCEVGETVATSACKLTHVKKILHTVGPRVWDDLTKDHQVQLLHCYATALELAVEHDLKSIAFPCISTSIYGYPNNDAAASVINFLCEFFLMSPHKDKIDRVVLCVFLEVDDRCYKNEIRLFSEYFTKLEARSGKDGLQEISQSQQADHRDVSTGNESVSSQTQPASTEASTQSRSTGRPTLFQSLLNFYESFSIGATKNKKDRANAIHNDGKMSEIAKEVVPAQVDVDDREKAAFKTPIKL